MKSFMLATLVALAVFQQAESRLLPSDNPHNRALDINSIFDSVVEKLKARLKDSALDPLPLPDKTFSLGGLLIGGVVEVGLKNGKLHNLMSMKRGGNASLESSNKIFTVQADINFDGPEIAYDFVATAFVSLPNIPIGATVKDFGAHVELEVDLSKQKMKLKALHIKTFRKIQIHIGTLGVLDWALSTVTNMVTEFFKTEVIAVVETVVHAEAKKVVESFDLSGLIG